MRTSSKLSPKRFSIVLRDSEPRGAPGPLRCRAASNPEGTVATPPSPLRCICFLLHSSHVPPLPPQEHPPPDMLAPPRMAAEAGLLARGPAAARCMAIFPAAPKKLGEAMSDDFFWA